MANLVYCNDNKWLKNNYYFALSTTSASNPTQLPSSHTGIANSGVSGFYFAPGMPVANLDPKAPTIGVRVANGLPEKSVASVTLASAPSLPPASMQGHVMPSFPHTLIGLGPFADLGCQIVFIKTAVSVIHPDEHSILDGWQEHDGPCLWRFPLMTTMPILPEFARMHLEMHVEKPVPCGSTADATHTSTNPPHATKPILPEFVSGIASASRRMRQRTPGQRRRTATCKRFSTTLPQATMPSLLVSALCEQYEETSPCGRAADFFKPPLANLIQRPAALCMPSMAHPLAAAPTAQPHPYQGVTTIDKAGQACLVTYIYGASQAMALLAPSSKNSL
jgi:hypothetical protein